MVRKPRYAQTPAAMRLASGLFAILLTAACSSGPERRSPQGGGGSRGGGGDGFGSVAAQPISLLFVSMDTNADKRIDGVELSEGVKVEWNALSISGRVGALDYGQWALRTFGDGTALPSFMMFDRDLNGRMTEAEFNERIGTEFATLDVNRDGVLERSEMVFTVSARSQGQEGRGGQGGGRGGQERQRPQ